MPYTADGTVPWFPEETGRAFADADGMALEVGAPGLEGLECLKGVVSSHLERFGSRDGLTMSCDE
ncbi:DUF2218 domain-containing protein [Streptomyces sp. NPDC004065]|uniref:DUF2218 domain-containing protein n=1 Tax=Streptomyces sp. NPDC004065 TaxID=3364689 RepID=UPI00384AAE0B